MTNLSAQVRAHLRPFIESGATLILAVSGGPDSLALLHAAYTTGNPASLVVAHLDHSLRPESAAEANFVRQTAAAWRIPCYVQQVNVSELAARENRSIEEAGRLARYRFLAQLAHRLNAVAVAVAHNADDQAETVLMHLLRGSGLAGLQGMLPVSTLPGAPGVWLIRPLLHVERAEIEQYCQAHGLQPLFDLSNQDPLFLRNRIRHQLLPLLAAYNPQIKTRLQQLAEIVAADVALLEQLLAEKWPHLVANEGPDWLRFSPPVWRQLPLSLQRLALRRAVAHLQPALKDVGFRSIEQARLLINRERAGSRSLLPGGLLLLTGRDWILVTADPTTIPIELPQLPGDQAIHLPVPGQVKLTNDWYLEASVEQNVTLAQIETNEDAWQAFVDTPEDILWVRPRQPGEKFQPLGMNGRSARVKDVMINRYVPAALRAHWPIVATPAHLVWLVGHHVDERVRVTAVSRRIIHLRCRRQKEVAIS